VTVWADTAQRIVPEFERATGVVLGAGIKLLVRARPQFHALYGLSLSVDAIDPAFTLGDLEAKKRDIRLRLQQEGLFDANRRLPPPWDFNHVLVVAPEGAAGLGDFRAEAQRLAHHGLCQFSYAHARFQGEGAPDDIRHALLAALHAHHAAAQAGTALPLDAVVLIRGGGAVNDLAWLNDLALARTLCELPLPVFTGIGHERDRTVLDEVAQLAFDTPSKVVAGIEQRIAQRAAQAREHFATLVQAAQRQLAQARQGSAQALQSLQTHAHHSLAQAERQRQTAWQEVQRGTQRQLALARQAVPAQLAQVQAQARQQLRDARHLSASGWAQVLERSRSGLALAREALHHEHTDLGRLARLSLGQARQHSQALMREIAGQGPDKTLGRGFALVRQADTGQALTAAAQAAPGARLTLQFHDGGLAVVVPPVCPDTP
jgi:exodeoxyribonuclease VII large subunit